MEECFPEATDRGLQFGDGHFTTVRVRAGQLCLWPQHLNRLLTAQAQLQMSNFDPEQLSAAASNRAQQIGEGVLKVIVTRGDSTQGYGYSDDISSHIYLNGKALQLPAPTPLNLFKAELTLSIQPLLAGIKTLNRLEQVLLSQEQQRRQCQLWVADHDQQIYGGVQANLFWRVNGRWHTPQISGAGVNGIARQQLLSSGLMGEVEVAEFPCQHLAEAEQAFLCNCVRGIQPIAQLDGRALEVLDYKDWELCLNQ